MRNKIYAKNTEYIACRKNLSKNLHFRKTFVYLGVIGYGRTTAQTDSSTPNQTTARHEKNKKSPPHKGKN